MSDSFTSADQSAASSESGPSRWRWVRWSVIVGVIIVIILGIYSATSMFWAVQGVRDDTYAASSALTAGDFSAAAPAVSALAESSTELESVTGSLVWSLASHLPGVGGTIAGLHQMAGAVAEVAVALTPVMDQVASAQGTTQRIAVLAQSSDQLRELADASLAAERRMSSLDPADLKFGLGEQLIALQDGLPQAADLAVAVADASEVIPDMLGMNGRRTWLIALQNPAESRGSGGLFSGYALVEFVDGQPTILEANTRKKTLDDLDIPYRSVVDSDSAELWGPYLEKWASFNLSADFPTVARLAAAGMAERGTPVDGVIALDAYVVQALLAGTGKVEHRGVTIDGTNAGEFFTRDLYALYPDFPDVESKDQLALGLVYATIDSLLKRPLDYPVLVESVPPLVASGHLKAWSPNPVEEAWLQSIGLGGDLASLDPRSIVVSFNNSTGGKLDSYVTPSVQYDVGTCRYDTGEFAGMRQSVVTVRLQNDAPAGLPPYVDIRLDDPTAPAGSTKTLVQVYGPAGAGFTVAYMNGDVPGLARTSEAGRPVWVVQAEMNRGQTSETSIVFIESNEAVPDPAVVVPGTAIPAQIEVREIGSTTPCGEFAPTVPQVQALVGSSG